MGLASLTRFVDGLLQTFEDRRSGLSDQDLAGGEAKVAGYFLTVYQGEAERLKAIIAEAEPHLAAEGLAKLQAEIDHFIQTTVVPAYARLSGGFTPRERRDFFLVGSRVRVVERIGWALAGMALGVLAIRLPFIPIWSKEWVIPFVITGFIYPEVRRYFALRRYERDLNVLVAHAEREIGRLDRAYLQHGEVIDELKKLEKES